MTNLTTSESHVLCKAGSADCSSVPSNPVVKISLGVGVGTAVFMLVFLGIGFLEMYLRRRAEAKFKRRFNQPASIVSSPTEDVMDKNDMSQNCSSVVPRGDRKQRPKPGLTRVRLVAEGSSIRSIRFTTEPEVPHCCQFGVS